MLKSTVVLPTGDIDIPSAVLNDCFVGFIIDTALGNNPAYVLIFIADIALPESISAGYFFPLTSSRMAESAKRCVLFTLFVLSIKAKDDIC